MYILLDYTPTEKCVYNYTGRPGSSCIPVNPRIMSYLLIPNFIE